MSNKSNQRHDWVLLLRILMLFWLMAAGLGKIPAQMAQDQNLYWLNTQTGDFTVWYMNGATWSGNYDYLGHNIPLQWQLVGNGDFNNDSVTDFIWYNSQTGDVTYWL